MCILFHSSHLHSGVCRGFYQVCSIWKGESSKAASSRILYSLWLLIWTTLGCVCYLHSSSFDKLFIWTQEKARQGCGWKRGIWKWTSSYRAALEWLLCTCTGLSFKCFPMFRFLYIYNVWIVCIYSTQSYSSTDTYNICNLYMTVSWLDVWYMQTHWHCYWIYIHSMTNWGVLHNTHRC